MTANRALKTDDYYELVINAARLPVWFYDVPSNTVSGNVYWHRNLGYHLTEAQAAQRVETWLSDVHPDDVPRFDHIFSSSAADSTGFYETQFRIRTASGEYKWVLERGRVVERDAHGKPLKVVGICIDIDARKRTEDSLRESERRLRAVIDASPVPMGVNDEQGNITYLNPAFSQSFGYVTADIPTLVDWWACAYPDPQYRRWVRETWAERLESAQRTNGAFEPMEVIIRCMDGTERTAIAYAAPLAGVSADTHLVVLVDVSELRRLERAILIAASREQHRIGMDLHDGLGQKLTGLSLMLTGLTRSARSIAVESLVEELATLATLASDCIATTRTIAHGLAPVELGSGSLACAFRRLAEATEKSSGLQVEVRCADLENLRFEQTISEPLYRVVQEALTNAAKHAQATHARIDAEFRSGILTITVTDNGCGLPQYLDGHGLGLSTMRYRARALGGRIELESPQGLGTRVLFTCEIQPGALTVID